MSRAREALRVLRENQYRRLILLGDIFADLNFGRLKKEHWKFLGFIRKLSNPKRNVEVVWVEGNHDLGLAQIMSHLVGVRVFQEYRWEYRGQRHIAAHGHQFDGFVVSNVQVSYWIGTILYLQLQKWDSKNKTLTRFLDRLNTRWLRLSPKVADGALAHMESTTTTAGPGSMRIRHISPWGKMVCRSTNMSSGRRIFNSARKRPRPTPTNSAPARDCLRMANMTGNTRESPPDLAGNGPRMA